MSVMGHLILRNGRVSVAREEDERSSEELVPSDKNSRLAELARVTRVWRRCMTRLTILMRFCAVIAGSEYRQAYSIRRLGYLAKRVAGHARAWGARVLL